MDNKAVFLKTVTVYVDTREKENQHILTSLDSLKVKHEPHKLDAGDYSFSVGGKDFSLSCSVERKASPDELYSNIMDGTAGHKGERIEKEFESAYRNLTDFTLLIEGIASADELRAYTVPEWKMKACPERKVANIGVLIYPRIQSWKAGNRYHINVEYVKDPTQTAAKILERFYYYYSNYTRLIAPRR